MIRLNGLPDGDGRFAPLRRGRLSGRGHIVDQLGEIRRGYGIVRDVRGYNLSRQGEHSIVGHAIGPSQVVFGGTTKGSSLCLVIIMGDDRRPAAKTVNQMQFSEQWVDARLQHPD